MNRRSTMKLMEAMKSMSAHVAVRGLCLLGVLAGSASLSATEKPKWCYTQPGALPPKDAKVVAGPAVRREADGRYAISFKVDKPCDVAVRIVDGAGETVRHLAAGVLGDSAPEPFQAGALAQTVHWDGRNDAGEPVKPKGLRARVDVCVKAELDRLLGFQPGSCKRVVLALDVDQRGNVYVLNGGGRTGHLTYFLYCYDRRGRYVRTVIPYNPNVPFERLRASSSQLARYGLHPFVKIPSGRIVPVACGGFSLNEKWPGLLGVRLGHARRLAGRLAVRALHGRAVPDPPLRDRRRRSLADARFGRPVPGAAAPAQAA